MRSFWEQHVCSMCPLCPLAFKEQRCVLSQLTHMTVVNTCKLNCYNRPQETKDGDGLNCIVLIILCICRLMIIFKLIPQSLLRTQFICLFNNVKFNNEFNLLFLSGLLDYARMQNTILASKCLQYKINN